MTIEQREGAEGAWRRALWILEALTLRFGPPRQLSPLQRRKLEQNLNGISDSSSLYEELTTGAPFLYCLLAWVERCDFDHPVLAHGHALRAGAWANLEDAAGSKAHAYGLLRSFAAERVSEPDKALSDVQIRAERVRFLLR